MLNDILTAIPFGFILAFTFGQLFFVLLETSAKKGFKSALIYDNGVRLADIIFILVTFFSTSKRLKKMNASILNVRFFIQLKTEESTSNIPLIKN